MRNFRLLTFYLFFSWSLGISSSFFMCSKSSPIEWNRYIAKYRISHGRAGTQTCELSWFYRGSQDFLTFLPASRQDSQSHGFLGISFWKLKWNVTTLNKNGIKIKTGNASACLSLDGALKHFSHEVRLSGRNAALCYKFFSQWWPIRWPLKVIKVKVAPN